MTQTKTHWKKQTNPDYLGSYAFEEGQDMILTIKETKVIPVKNNKGEAEQCFTCFFSEPVKPLILNKTNCKAIEKVLKTPFIEEWVGKKIQLYVQGGVKAFGSVVDAVRVRDFAPETEKLDVTPVLKRINASTTLAELKANYETLSKPFQSHQEVIKAKDEMKVKLSAK